MTADAAAALALVEVLGGVELGDRWRREALASLGSDAPFFDVAKETGAALCTGRGEQVAALPGPSPAWWIGLLTPETRCPTSTVYRALEFPLRPLDPAPNVRELLKLRAMEARAGLVATDLPFCP